MSEIQLLPVDVINQIAAGEVVERPAHLIKELLENSVDAESTTITIHVREGGKNIQILDDGIGISKDDLKWALTRHATSKIKKTQDLWNLSSFGFRGEALASISAVSDLKLSSKSRQDSDAFQIHSLFGQMSDVRPASKSIGTDITINRLFENVPARFKFLKSDSTENSQIKNVVKAMALSHPQVEFKLIIDGELILFFAKDQSHSQRAQQVLGVRQIFNSSAQREGYSAQAFYASPQDVAKNSKNIWIFAQNRWIQDRGLQAAVTEAYRSLLMHGEYPQVVVYLSCPPDQIDVNISPTKSQVKFQDPSLAFRAVQASLRDGLETAPWIIRSHISQTVAQKSASFSITSSSSSVEPTQPAISLERAQTMSFKDERLNQTVFQKKEFHSDLFKETPPPRLQDLAQLKVEEKSIQVGYWSKLQVLGQMNLTYIVCQKEDRMVLVDQHAAHERVAFEKLMSRWKGQDIDLQNFLFPLAIDLSEEKCEALLKKQEDLVQMGIEIEQLGPMTVGVKSAPSFIKESGLAKALEKMAEDCIDHGDSFQVEKTIGDLFATMACHSVVRAGQSLSFEEMTELLQAMDEFPLSSFCPHGRPVSVEMSFFEIEKLFGRILS